MAVDLRIEAFSIDLFRYLWYKSGIKQFVLPRLNNYDEVTYEITCIDAICHAVICRRSFYKSLLKTDIYFDFEIYSNSGHEFYLYLQNNLTKFFPYNELNIFDKLFMSSAVILEMASTCVLKCNNMYPYYAPLCWAMYFDTECKEEFYDKGGWRGLELHANSYKSRVFIRTHGNEEWLSSARSAYIYTMNVHYSFDDTDRVFKEKILKRRNKVSCSQCLPLFHVVRTLSGTSDEDISEFQLTEGYLQIILRMLTVEELRKRERECLQGTEFETFKQIVDIGCSYIEIKEQQKSELLDNEKISYKTCDEYFDEYRIQNTKEFLSRLFKAHDGLDTVDQCMFCGCSVNEIPKALKSTSDYQAEKIKSVIDETLIETELEDDESTEVYFEADKSKTPEEEDAIKTALQMFFSLGVEPARSYILANLVKRKENQNNDSFAKMKSPKAPENEMKGNTGRKKKKK